MSFHKSDLNLYFHPILCMGRFSDCVLLFVLKLSYLGIIECPLVPACVFQDFSHKSMVVLSLYLFRFSTCYLSILPTNLKGLIFNVYRATSPLSPGLNSLNYFNYSFLLLEELFLSMIYLCYGNQD